MAGPASMLAVGRSLPTLGPRGEGWVLIQFILLGLIAIAGTTGPAWDGPARTISAVAGLVLLGLGTILAGSGLFGLRHSITALPHPRADGRLVAHGAYRLVRHPIYGGIILGALGWGLLTAAPAAILAAFVLLGFFDLKSRREEAWLVDHYAGYAAYRASARRLIPWIY